MTPWTIAPPGSSVHGIFQASILERVAISSSRGSSQLRDRTLTSCISFTGRWIFYHCGLKTQEWPARPLHFKSKVGLFINNLENSLSSDEGNISHSQLNAVNIFVFPSSSHCITFTNDFVAFLALIIAFSYSSNSETVTLKTAFPEHSSCAD